MGRTGSDLSRKPCLPNLAEPPFHDDQTTMIPAHPTDPPLVGPVEESRQLPSGLRVPDRMLRNDSGAVRGERAQYDSGLSIRCLGTPKGPYQGLRIREWNPGSDPGSRTRPGALPQVGPEESPDWTVLPLEPVEKLLPEEVGVPGQDVRLPLKRRLKCAQPHEAIVGVDGTRVRFHAFYSLCAGA